MGFADDTANGLLVPVIRVADKKGLVEIAKETASTAEIPGRLILHGSAACSTPRTIQLPKGPHSKPGSRSVAW